MKNRAKAAATKIDVSEKIIKNKSSK